jgi:toxin ParE1/3/4
VTAAYRLTPTASEGVRRIARYVDEHFGSMVAERVVSDLEHAFERIAANPRIGHRREDLTRDHAVLGPTLIAYRSKPDWVEVLLVERGELDWERILEESLE